MSTPAIFLDRDDTLIACTTLPPPPPPGAPGDLINPALVQLLPGVHDSCHTLIAAGFTLVVVSNQGSVARGIATPHTVERVNHALRTALHLPLLPCYYCPFHPKGHVPYFTREHHWRKPAPGMLTQAAADLDLDLSRSWLIGDAQRDLEAGLAAGLHPSRCLRVWEPPLPAGTPLSFAAACAQILYATGA